LNVMQQANWQIKGLEPDEGARKQAQNLYQLQPDEPQQLFSLALNSFDAVTMWHVLEHVHELHAYIKQIHAILKQNGVFFIAVPNYTSLDAEIYQAHWAAYDVPRHLYHFSPESMKVLLQKYGFTIQEHKMMPFDSFYISLISEKYKTGKSNLFKGFWNGFKSYWKALGNPQKCSSVLYIVTKK
ncbi:MAG: class I SAM-dependent methyltransferase, partial [Bacteroidia bacterium]